jgi:excinuclease UvrABC nuclease subunit
MATKSARQALYERLEDEMQGLHADMTAAALAEDYERTIELRDRVRAIFDLLVAWDRRLPRYRRD